MSKKLCILIAVALLATTTFAQAQEKKSSRNNGNATRSKKQCENVCEEIQTLTDIITTLNAKVEALDAKIETLIYPSAAIGDLRNGGVVFWVDPTDNRHGLVCSFSSLAGSFQWGCYGIDLPTVPSVITTPPSGLGAEIGDGASNTNNILRDCPTSPAALAARSLGSDWFLPTIGELTKMYNNRVAINETAIANGAAAFSLGSQGYWSSTEVSKAASWKKLFSNGSNSSISKGANGLVRAVRAF